METATAKTTYFYQGEPTGTRCPYPCGGMLRVKEEMSLDNLDKGVPVVCEKCGNESNIVARYCKAHSKPEDASVTARTTAVVPWVKAAMDVPKEQVAAVMPGYSALWGDKVPMEIKTLCARVAIAYGLDPLAGELIVLGGKPYTTCQGRIRNAERHDDYEGFDTAWVVDPQVRAAMGLRDGDICIEATGYRRGRRPCKAWGIVRPNDTNPVAKSNPQEVCYKRGVERVLRHMYAMPLPSAEERPDTEADYYRQQRVDTETGEISPVIGGEVNTTGSTQDQRKAIHVLLNEIGIPDDAYKAELQRLYGVETSLKLNSSQASEYIDALKRRERRHEHGSPLAAVENALEEMVDDVAAGRLL